MTTTPQNDGGEIDKPEATCKITTLKQYLNYQYPATVGDIRLRNEIYRLIQVERELHQANIQIAMDTIRLQEITELGIKRDIELEQIESLKQEVIEWRDDRQKVNADLNEELIKANEQSTKKSELVSELAENLANELNYLYWSAYHSGHHDTVEGQYTDVFREDRFTYHEHKVADCLDSGDMQILLKLSRAANL